MYSCLLSFFLFSQKLHPKQTLAIFFFETLLKQVKCHRRKHAGGGIHKAKIIILQRQKPLCNRAGVYQIFYSLLFAKSPQIIASGIETRPWVGPQGIKMIDLS